MRSKTLIPKTARMVAFALAAAVSLTALPLASLEGASAVSSHAGGVSRGETGTIGCLIRPGGFVDVRYSKFKHAIDWLGCRGISTGTRIAGEPNKSLYAPKESLTREAMAAFLFRIQDRARGPQDPAYVAPTVSPFADVQPGDKFYREIAWMHEKGISTGTAQPSGKPMFEPKETLSREAMAAFLFRHQGLQGDGDKTLGFVTPPVTRFTDITPKSRFYREIAWMDAAKISTGVRVGSTVEYQPKQSLTREAMAAFLYRLFKVTETDNP